MFFPIFLLIFGFSCAQNTTKLQIRIGIAAAQLTQPESIGWSFCGGAVTMAIQRLHQMGIATGFDFETFVEYTECDRNATVAIGLDFLKNKNVDVIIGPPCVEGLKVMGTLTQLYQKPVLGWGFVSDSIFSDKSRFPLTVSMLPTSSSLGYATVKVLEHFGWDKVAILYVTSALNYCASVMDDVESVLNDPSSFSPQIVLKQYLEPKNNESYTSTLQTVMGRARIILFCAQTATEKRDYMLRIAKLGMNTNEYVHIMLSMRSVGFGAQTNNGKMTFTLSGLTPLWETLSGPSDGQESLAKSAAEKFLVIDLNSEVSDVAALTNLQKNIIASVRMPPVNCGTPQCLAANGTVMGAYARHLYDAIWLYGVAIDGMSAEGWRNVTEVLARIRKANFAGMTGQVRFNENATRMPIYQLYGLSDKWDEVALMNLNFDNGSSTLIKLYTNESAIWSTHWAGSAPLATPICGYAGTACPQTTLEKYGVLFVILAIVILFTCLVFVCCGCALIRGKRAEAERVRSEWVIAFEKLRELERSGRKSRSRRSLDSAPGSQDTRSAGDLEDQDESEEYRSLEKEIVRVKKYHPGPLDTQRFVKLRKLDHENVNKFIGLVLNGPGPYFAVWKLCGRGNLEAIIARGNFTMDAFFVLCVIRDVAEGLAYLHQAFLAIGGARVHGSLRSGNCLVNDSWQVKLSDYGLDFLNEEEAPPKRYLLWTAPEVLRSSILPRNMDQSADVYSFAIISSEIVTKKEAWNLEERKEKIDEILYQVKKGGSFAMRPDILAEDMAAQQNLIRLIKDCWAENPEDRPNMSTVCKILMDQMPKTNTNLMDHVFNMLEEYTTTLEVEVEERTKELTNEKKKADILLGKMLPKQVAERLKMGQTVEPEGFDSVTVMFSDVVKFTQLAAKCSPFQVVNMLNDLFSNLDTIIENHGVYKVESIGDGYLCVSGLPTRNGYAHIKQIIDMSLEFMNFVRNFKIAHLPREKVELRIGVNSGPCVAGVVGLSMPRYCLFGDTVNTASRMESNGKPSHIHLSSAANSLLNLQYPGKYCSFSRGEVIIKGKGVMETFWVAEKNAEAEGDAERDAERSISPIVANLTDNENVAGNGVYRNYLKVS